MYYASRLDSSSLPIFDITYFSDYKNFSEIKRFIPIWSYLNIILISRERKICSSRSHLLKRQFTYLYLNPLSYIHGCNLNKIEFLTFLPIPNSICVSILFFFFYIFPSPLCCCRFFLPFLCLVFPSFVADGGRFVSS